MSSRRVILVEIDTQGRRWSRSELEAEWNDLMPDRRPVVMGEVAGSEVDAAYRKLRQLSSETEADRPIGDRIHSAHKALSFFRDCFPDRFWEWFAIGQPHDVRKRLLSRTDGGAS